MNINSAFPSAYLKADDLGKNRPVVTIRTVKLEEVGDGEKPVVYFEGKDKGIVLNKTNASAIAEIAGTSETDEWGGVKVRLYSTKVDFQGRRVNAIRIEEAPAPPVTAGKGKGRPAPVPEPVDDEPFADVEDDEIPF